MPIYQREVLKNELLALVGKWLFDLLLVSQEVRALLNSSDRGRQRASLAANLNALIVKNEKLRWKFVTRDVELDCLNKYAVIIRRGSEAGSKHHWSHFVRLWEIPKERLGISLISLTPTQRNNFSKTRKYL